MIDRIRSVLEAHRFTVGNEADLQLAIDGVLAGTGLAIEREVRLNARDRLDFLVYPHTAAEGGTAIEVKVDGSATALHRQLARYAKSERVIDIVVVTNRARLCDVPKEIGGKRVEVISLLSGAL